MKKIVLIPFMVILAIGLVVGVCFGEEKPQKQQS